MRLIITLAFLLTGLIGCRNNGDTITGDMWSGSDVNNSVIIDEKNLTEDGKEKLDKEIGNGVFYDKDKKFYVIRVSGKDDWGLVTLKVLATPLAVVADGVKYTVVVAVSNPQLTAGILETILKR